MTCMAAIRLPVQPHSVQAVDYTPHSCSGRGCARLRLPAALAQAALAAAPRLRCFRPDVSLDVWHSREERRWVQTAIATQPAPGQADAAGTWRPLNTPAAMRPTAASGLRSAAPAFVPLFPTKTTPGTATTAWHPAMPIAAVMPPPVAALPPTDNAILLPTAATRPAAQPPIASPTATAATQPAAPETVHSPLSPSSTPPGFPSPAPSSSASPPVPTGPNGELEFYVEAFMARQVVDGCIQYLVKWLGYELVGEEAAHVAVGPGAARLHGPAVVPPLCPAVASSAAGGMRLGQAVEHTARAAAGDAGPTAAGRRVAASC